MRNTITLVVLFSTLVCSLSAAAQGAKSSAQELAEIKSELQTIKGDLQDVKDSISQIADAFQRSAMRGKNVADVKLIASESMQDDFALGDPNAPVLVVEFTDFQCGFCARFAKATFPPIRQEYIDSGKLRYVFRDFPLQMHTHAPQAASVASCAQQQGKFMQMHDALFESAEEVNDGDFESVYERIPDLDRGKLKACLESERYRLHSSTRGPIPSIEVQEDMKDAGKLGVSATPSFFVGKNGAQGSELKGVLVRGSQSFDTFKEIINEYLN